MKKQKTFEMTVIAILTSIVIVVSFLPIRTLGLEITLTMIFVAVGAVVFGKKGGAVLGTVFGLVSFFQCFGYSPFGAAIFGINPIYAFLTCVPTRILAGFLAGAVADALRKKPNLSCTLACVIAPVLNTLFFMTVLLLCYYRTDYIQNFANTLHAANPFTFAVLFVGINGLVEAAVGIVVAIPVSTAVIHSYKKIH